MSMVNRVLLLLNMEAKELIRAASITASIRPLRPADRGQPMREEIFTQRQAGKSEHGYWHYFPYTVGTASTSVLPFPHSDLGQIHAVNVLDSNTFLCFSELVNWNL